MALPLLSLKKISSFPVYLICGLVIASLRVYLVPHGLSLASRSRGPSPLGLNDNESPGGLDLRLEGALSDPEANDLTDAVSDQQQQPGGGVVSASALDSSAFGKAYSQTHIDNAVEHQRREKARREEARAELEDEAERRNEEESHIEMRDPNEVQHWVRNLRPRALGIVVHLGARDIERERNRTKVLARLESGEASMYMTKHEINVALNDQKRVQGGHDLVSFALNDHRGTKRHVDIEAEFMDALPNADMLFQRRQRLRERLELDESKVPSVYRTCAIVGNSGTMIGSAFGKDIDANDMVLRINYAPTKGYEADVGTKTTYDLCNKENTLKLATGEHKWRWIESPAPSAGRPPPRSDLVLFEMHSRIIRQQVYLRLLKRRDVKGGHGPRMWFLNPALISASRSVWYEVKEEVERDVATLRRDMSKFEGEMSELRKFKPASGNYSKVVLDIARRLTERDAARRAANGDEPEEKPRPFRFNNKPMSGVVAMYFALQFCETISLYGFDAFKGDGQVAAAAARRNARDGRTRQTTNPGGRSRSKYHYFDDREGMTDVHSFDYAIEFYNRIGQHVPVNVISASPV
ncbi:ST3 beta-galactoside alpha-2,3-sialyltransferase 1 [Pycnococcus provasolii]|uniref:ST3 beta-galactoside alpha-2,3-sialyltransferase 1 n=1 Tax=Pycnococcus provasolii TaxID=41880 RepID=A0A830HT95_9CHLO|nr:ST3 beta-galactoside alpha-2,3-sialyltransferase 1 [Pycnococcus provasolii]